MSEIEKKELVGLEYMELMRDTLKRMLGDDRKNPKPVKSKELKEEVAAEIIKAKKVDDVDGLKRDLGKTNSYLRHMSLIFENIKGIVILTENGYEAIFDEKMMDAVKE
ncbi:MAG: hypothetical protein IKD13_05410 [Firmicutes bacterium]|nr:hypothetical protein [Bacillota bacterium]